MKRRGELQLIERAIKQGWPISDRGRRDAMALVEEVLNDPHATSREQLRACKIVLAMDLDNILTAEDARTLATVKAAGKRLEQAAKRGSR